MSLMRVPESRSVTGFVAERCALDAARALEVLYALSDKMPREVSPNVSLLVSTIQKDAERLASNVAALRRQMEGA